MNSKTRILNRKNKRTRRSIMFPSTKRTQKMPGFGNITVFKAKKQLDYPVWLNNLMPKWEEGSGWKQPKMGRYKIREG